MSAPSDSRGFHLDDDDCLNLLHGLLPPAEMEKLLDHLSGCTHCERMFQEVAGAQENLRATRVLRRGSDGTLCIETRGDRAHPAPSAHLRVNLRRIVAQPRFRIAGAVAAALVLLALILWPSPYSPELRWLPSAGESGDLGQLQTPDWPAPGSAYDVGLKAYDRRDLEAAIERLGHAEVTGHYEDIRKTFLGSALAWRGDYQEALSVLPPLLTLDTLPEPWSDAARWTLYVCLHKAGRRAVADSLLRAFADEEGELGEWARDALIREGVTP